MLERKEIRFIANPVQRAFVMSRAEADLFNSRQGEGKSAGLCWALFEASRANPVGYPFALIRDTWVNLERTTQREFFTWFPPGVMGEYHAGRKEFRWFDGVGMNGNTMLFMGLDDPKDAHKLQSLTLAGFGIDEPAPVDLESGGGVSEEVFDVAFGRCRAPGCNFYARKLTQNNPDEDHWTYRRFVDPGMPPHDGPMPPTQEAGFRCFQTAVPENLRNLPRGYYEGLRRTWAHRPDLVARLVDGNYWRNTPGSPVTPQYDDRIHTALGLVPVKGEPLWLGWDGGHRPTCVISQVVQGQWRILEAVQELEAGTYQLIEDQVAPIIAQRYRGFEVAHVVDPSLETGDQSDINNSPVRVIRKALPGRIILGPVSFKDGVEPLRRVLSVNGKVRVDRDRAGIVRGALRGKWHFKKHNTGVVGREPVKDEWSDPGDCCRYLAGVLFPLGASRRREATHVKQAAVYWH